MGSRLIVAPCWKKHFEGLQSFEGPSAQKKLGLQLLVTADEKVAVVARTLGHITMHSTTTEAAISVRVSPAIALTLYLFCV